ncbi:MAG: sulfate ABC transporter ATP-binding protein [Acidobacteria bacterium]|nr:sulfate ABC transporter ATP-binding protein [Acidobacteriota bacterium]
MGIEVRNITKRFGTFTALDGVSLEVPTGELVALLGPSGSGKTTLLRIVAGLEYADQGQVLLDGEDTTRSTVRQRRVGFVFQHYALFRHMTVVENVAFGLRVKPRGERPPRAQIKARVNELLKMVQLDWLADRYPAQLSGGQRQRVALARALAVEPRLLLLDEPFGSLDAKVRRELRMWLRRLHDDLGITSLFVTHDQEEALELADRIAVMNEGHIEQVGTPADVYDRPASAFVYQFLGSVNLFHGRVEGGKVTLGGQAAPAPAAPDEASALIYVRPHFLDISRETDGRLHFPAQVMHINPAGPLVKVDLVTEWGAPVHVEISQERYRALALQRYENVLVCLEESRMLIDTVPKGNPVNP